VFIFMFNLFIIINKYLNKFNIMKKEDKLYGCGCKGGTKPAQPATTTTQTTTTVPTVQPTSGN
jgi:hypothetical protein